MHNIAPDKGFAAEGSYWAPPAIPGDVSSDPGDLEILPKRQAPVASLPGVSQKQQRKDKKQEDRRAKLAKSPEEIQDNIEKLLAATDAIVEHTEEREAILSVQRSENDQLEERSREIGMDETEELAVNAAIIRAHEKQREERNALVAQERELEGNIQMSTDLIRDTRARASALGSSSRDLPKLTKKIETWERHRKEYEEDLQKLRERGQPQAQLIITDPNAADETFEELLRQVASEELPPVPAIPEPERGGPASEQASEPTEEKAAEAKPEERPLERGVAEVTQFSPRTATARADILAVHGVGGMDPSEFSRQGGTVTALSEGWETASEVSARSAQEAGGRRQAGGQGYPLYGLDVYAGVRRRRRPGQQFLTSEPADEIPEEDAASSVGFHAPDASTVHAPSMEAGAPPVRRRKVGTPQSVHGRNLRRQIMPVLRQANFSLRKVSANRYLVYAKDVSEGVIAQIRALLKKITGRRVLVDGRIFGKQGAFREIIRILREKGSVDVSVS
ncbi:TPA: hypothetical protein EYO57_25840 [Candidatus Poribacteria bacterium]|nr:hypothetical protein [Candidatus Poribacteria bacterium]